MPFSVSVRTVNESLEAFYLPAVPRFAGGRACPLGIHTQCLWMLGSFPTFPRWLWCEFGMRHCSKETNCPLGIRTQCWWMLGSLPAFLADYRVNSACAVALKGPACRTRNFMISRLLLDPHILWLWTCHLVNWQPFHALQAFVMSLQQPHDLQSHSTSNFKVFRKRARQHAAARAGITIWVTKT